jgi:hypothetical protein
MKNPFINDQPCGEISDNIEALKAAIINYVLNKQRGDIVAMPLAIMNVIAESLSHYEEKARRLEAMAHAYMEIAEKSPTKKDFDLIGHLMRPMKDRIVEPEAVDGTNIIKLVRK